jgi:hypothetical protein
MSSPEAGTAASVEHFARAADFGISFFVSGNLAGVNLAAHQR